MKERSCTLTGRCVHSHNRQTVIDSATETGIPHMLVQDHAIQETDASCSGLIYASATGDPIPNLGEQKLQLVTGQ